MVEQKQSFAVEKEALAKKQLINEISKCRKEKLIWL
jgi:hypothetical protein